MKISVAKTICWCLLLVLLCSGAAAQELSFRAPPNANDPALVGIMRDLAVRVLPVYQENNSERYLSNLYALQMVAGDYPSAYATRQTLRDRRRNTPVCRAVVYDIYARARAIEAESRIPFAQAFTLAFRSVAPRLEDRDAYILSGCLVTPLSGLQEGFQRLLDQSREKGSLSIPAAIDLVWAFFAFEAYRSFGSLVGSLIAEDDRRRYLVENVVVRGPGKANIQAVVVRPKTLDPLPTLFELTIYDSQSYAKESAAHGYAGVVAYVRGVRGNEETVVPFENDGRDARAVIEWIAKQPWSNGDVAMHGTSYSGFVAWAATTRRPEALKAIATADPSVPGVTVPMMGNIFHSSAFRWSYHVSGAKAGSDKRLEDDALWRAYMREWYTEGRSYREFVAGDGPHNALFGRWLSHPSYDRFWQRMVPFGEQLAKIDIPVLTMTGYYADAQAGALFYFTQHSEHNPEANHTLLIGPFDDGALQRPPVSVLRGYTLDATAQVDLRELRYQWFDHILKKGEKPALLKDRVNYQLMGSNEWRHAPSIEAMQSGSLKLFPEETPATDRNRLTGTQNPKLAFLPQTFDLADRSDVDLVPQTAILSRRLNVPNAEMFVSEPMEQPVEVSGVLTGKLDLRINKMDMDLSIALYELLPSGEYLKLADPACDFRASYARDRTRRHLLKAGVRQQLSFRCERLMARRMLAGSRVVLVLGINKRPDQQINYGTGGDVSTESIEDAAVPLRIRWYNTSYIEIPIRR